MAALTDKVAKEEAMMDGIKDDDNSEVDNEDRWVDKMEDMMENKRIEVEELMWPVKLALAKVSQTFADAPLTQVAPPALQTVLQDHQFLNYRTASMERNVEQSLDDHHFDAKGCCNLMELNAQLAGIHLEASQGNWPCHTMVWAWLVGSWTDRWGVGNCRTTSEHS